MIYIDGEMDEYDLIERRIPYTQHGLHIIFYYSLCTTNRSNNSRHKNWTRTKVNYNKIDEVKLQDPVLVLDNLRSLSNYKENDSDDWDQ